MTIVYQDDLLSIETGVDMRNPTEELDISQEHGARDLSNSIKIKVNSSEESHFIQFVTRLVPDLFEFRQSAGKIVQWDSELANHEYHYMVVDNAPRWRVDTADDDSCFYDSAGAHKRTPEYTAMYDCPGGAQPIEERAIFCTFINVGDIITHKVQWSKQYDSDEKEFYTVQVQRCEFLPDWAIKTITEDPWRTNSYSAKTFQLPEPLLQRYNPSLSEENLLYQAREDFLQSPENWITRIKMPSLFPAEHKEEKSTIHHVKHRSPSPH